MRARETDACNFTELCVKYPQFAVEQNESKKFIAQIKYQQFTKLYENAECLLLFNSSRH